MKEYKIGGACSRQYVHLRWCPFCGKYPRYKVSIETINGKDELVEEIDCTNCEVYFCNKFKPGVNVVNIWNGGLSVPQGTSVAPAKKKTPHMALGNLYREFDTSPLLSALLGLEIDYLTENVQEYKKAKRLSKIEKEDLGSVEERLAQLRGVYDTFCPRGDEYSGG